MVTWLSGLNLKIQPSVDQSEKSPITEWMVSHCTDILTPSRNSVTFEILCDKRIEYREEVNVE